MKGLVVFAAAVSCCWGAETPDIASIMSRVAINQAKSQDLRQLYVYNQKQLLRLVRGGGKIAREERREYVITPKHRGVHKELTHFEGKYESHGKYFSYDKPGYEYKSVDIDGELINDMSNDMTDDHRSRDGIATDLFPLTYHQQLKYDFQLKGSEQYQGRQVYRVGFEPKKHEQHEDGAVWKGEALIDAEEYQPVLITSKLALNIPAPVKILLGTNVKGLGFSVTYKKFEDGVWFPVSYGGEFELRAVFLYKRTISISMVNSDFKKQDVTSTIAYSIEDK
jgi:hypothetical protein